MFRKNYHIKINLPGGIVATGDLYAIVEAAGAARVTHLRFGGRQQLLCKVADKYGEAFLSALDAAGVKYETGDEQYPNVVSSYVTEGIFEKVAGSWLSEGVYKDILAGFDFSPRLKVNLVESNQSFVPFFTGHINFISSGIGNYWYLYFRYPRTSRVIGWESLVYTQDIPRICREIEALLDSAGDRLYELVRDRLQLAEQPVVQPLPLPRFSLPYYEGFNQYGSKTWLGIYRRDELFPLAFLKDVCRICLQTRIGQLYTTPWKSVIIKGIETKDRGLWEYVLGKYRINVRHASGELGWQLEDGNEEAMRLKRYLVRQLDQEDTRTDGLCFAIKTRPGTGLRGSVIIRRQEPAAVVKRKAGEYFDILHTPDFNPNTSVYMLFREGLEKEELAVYLISLCKLFYERQHQEDLLAGPGARRGGEQAPVPVRELVHQCSQCLTIYDPQYGDPVNGAPAGTAFSALSSDYGCPVCGGGKEAFAPVEKSALIRL